MVEGRWQLVLVAVVSLAAGVLLGGTQLFHSAQGATQGQAGGVIALIGDAVSQDAPLVIVDVPDQSVVVYEYDYQSDEIELTAARTYQYDKLLRDYPEDHAGPTVREVRDFVRRR